MSRPPAQQSDSQCNPLHCHDRPGAGRPLAQRPESSGNHAGHQDALKKSPQNQLPKRFRRSRQQRRDGNSQQRGNNHPLARQPFRERSKHRRGKRHAQGGRGNREPRTCLRSVKDPHKKGQQRLRAVELKKGADSAQCNRHRGPVARRSAIRRNAIRLECGIQELG